MLKLLAILGGKTNFFSILIIIVILFLINSLIKNRNIRTISSIFSSIYIVAQSISLYFTNSLIGYQFYVHANLRGIIGMEGLFVKQAIISSLLLITITVLNTKSYSLNRNLNFQGVKLQLSKTIRISLIGLLFVLLLVKSTLIVDTKTLLPIFKLNDGVDFTATLSKYKIENYTKPDSIKATAGNNIIVISMESLEKAYLNGKFSSLTPNLNKFKRQWNYSDMDQNLGSSWTSGSLYTSLTGFPAFFGVDGNSIFYTAHATHITGITHVLKKSNYKISYLCANADFAGTKEMLDVFQFDKIIDYKNNKNTEFESPDGLRDKDLFKIAKKEAKRLNSSKEPFALFISTLDTHHPNGIYDERMESVISPKGSDLEFTVASLDYLIGDFISFLEKNNILENTTVYIFPDHLKMGSPHIFKDSGERKLFCITNSTELKFDNKPYQIDLPKIILQGAKIDHNMKFLTDYIEGDKSKYIKENITGITEINVKGVFNPEIETFQLEEISEHYDTYKQDTARYIAHAGGQIEGEKYTNSLEALEYSYSKGFRLFELDLIQTSDGHFVAAHDWELWATMTNFTGELPPTKEHFLSMTLLDKYTPLDMDSINKWFLKYEDAILVTDKVNSPIEISSLFIDKSRLMMELFDENSLREGLECEILSAIPSECVVQGLSSRGVKKLANNGVKHIAVSRMFIQQNKSLLMEFKANDIKAFAFGVNYEHNDLVDEDYVIKYEMDYIYGIYADVWSFEQ